MLNIFSQISCRIYRRDIKVSHKIRKLFTRQSLGIVAYEANRELELTYTDKPEEFRKEFRQNVDKTLPLDLTIGNLKRFVHIMTASMEDIILLRRSLRMYHTQSIQWKRTSDVENERFYIFGPIVMRALYYHDLPEIAMEFFEDERIGQLFDQMISYQILLDMLYDKQMYGDLLRINEIIQKRIQGQQAYSSEAINAILFATYFRLNTQRHHQFAFELYDEIKTNGKLSAQYRKSHALVAEMIRREQQPQQALDILAPFDDIDVNIRYVKILVNLDLNRFPEMFRLIRLTIESKHLNKNTPPPKIPIELLQTIEKRLKEINHTQWIEEIQYLSKKLKDIDRTMHKSLNDVLCARFPTKMSPYIPSKEKTKYISPRKS